MIAVTLIHGDDVPAVRQRLTQEQDRYVDTEIVRLNGETTTHTDIVFAQQNISLLAEKKLLLIQGFFSGRWTKEKEAVAKFLGSSTAIHPVIFWEDKLVEKTKWQKFFPKAREIPCKLPQLLFAFLDMVGSSDAKSLLTHFHQLLKQKEAEIIFVMLVRQVRMLLIVADGEVPPSLSSWQLQKFRRQSQFFSVPKLVSLYRQLLAIDVKIKTGASPLTLPQLLDIFLCTL